MDIRQFSRYIILISILIIIMISATGCPYEGVTRMKKERIKRERTEGLKPYTPPFIESLKRMEPYDPQRVKYFAMYYLLKLEALAAGKGSDENSAFEQLNLLDIFENPDSIMHIFNIGLARYDPTIGPPNEFITEQLDKRVKWVLRWGGYHSVRSDPFDELSKDVIRLGIPRIERFDISGLIAFIELTFTNIDHSFRYKEDKYYYYKKVPKDEPGYDRTSEKLGISIIKYINNKIYSQTDYETLEDIYIQPFIFPSRGINEWDGIEPYGNGRWLWTTAGIDIFGNLKNLKTTHESGRKYLILDIKYLISNFVTGDTVAYDSQRIRNDITGLSENDGFHVRMYTKPFHCLNSNSKSSSSYLLYTEISNGAGRYTENVHYTLPDDTAITPDYNIMLVSDNQPEQPKNMNPFYGIRQFRFGSVIHRGDSIKIWFPVTGMLYSQKHKACFGIVELVLGKKNVKKGIAGIIKKSIKFGEPGDTLGPIIDTAILNEDSLGNSTAMVMVIDTIISKVPNEYYQTSLSVSRNNISRGNDYVFIAFVKSRDNEERFHLITTATADVIVK